MTERPIAAFATPEAFERWIERQPEGSAGLWLKIAKEGAPEPTISYAQALDVALCFGWIDGQKNGLDDAYWLQRFTPRRPRSRWSKINRDKATALIAEGRMRPAGLHEVERAKADGRWAAAYEGQRTATVPEDLRRALDDNPAARDFFAGLTGANRYAILYRVQDAKRPETRARRIARFVEMLARGEKLYP